MISVPAITLYEVVTELQFSMCDVSDPVETVGWLFMFGQRVESRYQGCAGPFISTESSHEI